MWPHQNSQGQFGVFCLNGNIYGLVFDCIAIPWISVPLLSTHASHFPFRPASSSNSIISYSHFQSERIAKSNSIANETHLEIALRNHPSTPSAEAQKEPFWNATLPGSLCKHLPYRIPERWLIVVLSWWFVGKIQRHQNEILIWSAAPLLVHILYNATPSMTSTRNEGTICGRKKRYEVDRKMC